MAQPRIYIAEVAPAATTTATDIFEITCAADRPIAIIGWTIYQTTDMRAKLSRHHDDVDGVFWGWNNIWLHPHFKSWSIADDLAGIRCPLLAILGDDDEYSTPAQIEIIERNAVNASRFDYLKLADCRHSPHRDQPAIVLEAIGRFIDELQD